MYKLNELPFQHRLGPVLPTLSPPLRGAETNPQAFLCWKKSPRMEYPAHSLILKSGVMCSPSSTFLTAEQVPFSATTEMSQDKTQDLLHPGSQVHGKPIHLREQVTLQSVQLGRSQGLLGAPPAGMDTAHWAGAQRGEVLGKLSGSRKNTKDLQYEQEVVLSLKKAHRGLKSEIMMRNQCPQNSVPVGGCTTQVQHTPVNK